MPEKGPPVFLDYDQAALDAAYDQAAYAPNREQLIKRRISDSKLARLRVGEPERVAYGRPKSSGSTFTAADTTQHRSSSLYMAAPGAAAAQRILRLPPRCSSLPARIMSCPTSPGSRMSPAASWCLPIRSAAPSPWYTTMPRISAATRIGFMSVANPRAGTSLRSR